MPKKRKIKKQKPKSLKWLKKEADRLYQELGKKIYPVSIISGKPTELIHHFITKSKSNYLRYDFLNGIPFTKKEHTKHHRTQDPFIMVKIIKVNGFDWADALMKKKKTGIGFKLTKTYLREVISKFEEELKKYE